MSKKNKNGNDGATKRRSDEVEADVAEPKQVESGDEIATADGAGESIVMTEQQTDGPIGPGVQLDGGEDADGNPAEPIKTEVEIAQEEYDRLAKLCSDHAPQTRKLLREHDDQRKKIAEQRKVGLTQLLAQKLEATKRLERAKAEAGAPAAE